MNFLRMTTLLTSRKIKLKRSIRIPASVAFLQHGFGEHFAQLKKRPPSLEELAAREHLIPYFVPNSPHSRQGKSPDRHELSPGGHTKGAYTG
jgi:hypothetical protein